MRLIRSYGRVPGVNLNFKLSGIFFSFVDFLILSQLLAMDASARVSMKDAAKCDMSREWQNSEKQENAERILHVQITAWSMSTSGR